VSQSEPTASWHSIYIIKPTLEGLQIPFYNLDLADSAEKEALPLIFSMAHQYDSTAPKPIPGGSLSADSSATTTQLHLPPPDRPCLDDQTPVCWRLSEVKSILRSKNQRNISRLCRFRPFDEQFIATEISPSILEAGGLASYDVDWISTETLRLGEEMVAGILDKKSLSWLCKVPFEEWVHEALGLSPISVTGLRACQWRLSLTLRNFIYRHPEELEKFQTVAKVTWLAVFGYRTLILLKILDERNPFAHAVVAHACRGASQWKYTPLHLDFVSIVEPLQKVLSQPEPLPKVLQQLEVLAVRFRFLYHSTKIKLPPRFDATTPFLTLIREMNISYLAISRTQHDLEEFHKLRVSEILKGDEHTQSLNIRWNFLFRAVEECCAVDEVQPNLVQLAMVRILTIYLTPILLTSLPEIQVSPKLFFVECRPSRSPFCRHSLACVKEA
jgi:hypothetical protein